MIDATAKAGYSEVVSYLTDHKVKPLYQYIWIWFEDTSIMRRGKSWFSDRERQKKKSFIHHGPGCPTALLSVETVCPCFVHDPVQDLIALPCLSITPTIPEHFKDKAELHLDGLKVIKTPVSNFSCCPKYEYAIKETGEVLTSHEKDISGKETQTHCVL